MSDILSQGRGRGLCKRIFAVVKAANILNIPFVEAFEKQPTELLQLLSLKAQDSFDEARLLVQSHPLPATSIAKILAESFLKVCVSICYPIETFCTFEHLYHYSYILCLVFYK